MVGHVAAILLVLPRAWCLLLGLILRLQRWIVIARTIVLAATFWSLIEAMALVLRASNQCGGYLIPGMWLGSCDAVANSWHTELPCLLSFLIMAAMTVPLADQLYVDSGTHSLGSAIKPAHPTLPVILLAAKY